MLKVVHSRLLPLAAAAFMLLTAVGLAATEGTGKGDAASQPPAAKAPAPKEERAPAPSASLVTVSADRMEMEVGRKIVLEGNVLVEDARMQLSSDYVTIFFEEREGKKEPAHGSDGADEFRNPDAKISSVEATGHVMIRTADGLRSATGDRGFYDPAKDSYTLDGNCTILADGHALKSERVVFDRQRQTFTAGRASLTIQLNGKDGVNGHDLNDFFSVPKNEKKASADQKPNPAEVKP